MDAESALVGPSAVRASIRTGAEQSLRSGVYKASWDIAFRIYGEDGGIPCINSPSERLTNFNVVHFGSPSGRRPGIVDPAAIAYDEAVLKVLLPGRPGRLPSHGRRLDDGEHPARVVTRTVLDSPAARTPDSAAPRTTALRGTRGVAFGSVDPVVTMRPASPSDVSALLAFWQESAEDAHRPADTAAAVLALIDRDPEALILAVEHERIIGTIIAGWDGWRCHLYRLAVATDRRRQGVGRTLVEHAEARFRAHDAKRVDAMVLDDNADAHASWAANKYHPQPEWSRWVKPLT